MNRREFLAASSVLVSAGAFSPAWSALPQGYTRASPSLIIFSEDFRPAINSSEFADSSAGTAYSVLHDPILFGREHLELIKQHARAVVGVTTWLDYLLLQGLFREHEMTIGGERRIQLPFTVDCPREAHVWNLA